MAESHVVSALREKRAHISGEVRVAKQRLAKLEDALGNLDATLRLFEPGSDPGAIPARRPYKRNGQFRNGELPRLILSTLRASPEPMSAVGIAAHVVAQKGAAADDAALALVRKCVQSYLRRQAGALVETAGRANGSGQSVHWRLANA
jgi:hypothetical protein